MEYIKSLLDDVGSLVDTANSQRGAAVIGGVSIAVLGVVWRWLRAKPKPERSVINVSVPAGQSAKVEVDGDQQ